MVWVTWTGWLQSVRGCGDLVRSCAGQTLRREALELLTVTGRSLAPVSSGGAPNTPDVSETRAATNDSREPAGAGQGGRCRGHLADAPGGARPGVGRSRGGSADGDLARSGAADGPPGDAGPDDGRLRTGKETSSSLKYSQEVTAPDDEPERPGRSLATTNHEVIRSWAEARDGTPATVEGTEHGDHLGVLRIDFSGSSSSLRHVSWEEWFGTFDSRRLNFIYQEERSDGRQSTFFRLEGPDREDG